MDSNFKSIKSPLQMVGFYLAWIETVLAATFWPLKENDFLTKVLLYVMVSIASFFALAMIFMLIYFVLREPSWLFNPSDYDPSVQNRLFEHDQSISQAYKTKTVQKELRVGETK